MGPRLPHESRVVSQSHPRQAAGEERHRSSSTRQLAPHRASSPACERCSCPIFTGRSHLFAYGLPVRLLVFGPGNEPSESLLNIDLRFIVQLLSGFGEIGTASLGLAR